jgi:PAS domain S-box-containing protein
MDKELRILILEDNPADAELEEHELRKTGLVFTLKVVDTREAFMKELDEFPPDIVMSDYDLPAFDGLAALRIAKEKCPDVPFILVSGKLGEEFAIEALKEGAIDYILKNHLKRLGPSVKRAMEETELIAERKRSEDALIESDRKLRSIVENSSDQIFMLDKSLKYLLVNKSLANTLGKVPEEIIGKSIKEVFAPEIAVQFTNNIHKVFETAESMFIEETMTIQGQELFISTSLNPVLDDMRRVRAVTGIVRDITERKRAETETRWKTALLEAQMNATVDGILIVNEKGNKIIQNQRCIDLWKIPQHIVDNHDDKQQVEFVMNRAKDPEKFVEKVVYLYTHPNETSQEELEFKDGTILDRYSAPVIGKDGTYFGRIWVFRDVTNRVRAAEALRASEAQLRSILDSTPFPIALVDVQGNNIVFWSRSALTLFGHTAPTATEWYQIAYPDPDYRSDVINRWKPSLEKARLSGQAVNTGEYRITCRDGSVRICELYATFLAERLIVTFNDITERKKLEAQLLLAQKMEAVGELAGGIAHDFNNLLQSIIMEIATAKTRSHEDNVREVLIKAQNECLKAAELSNLLTTFSKGGTPIVRKSSITDMLKETVLPVLKGSPVNTEFAMPDDLWPVEIDERQIRIAINQLVMNAKEAMSSGGLLKVQARNIESIAKEHVPLEEGKYIKVTFADNGPGISPENLSKIFDPYFTTKQMGSQKGMGLSLAVSQSIIKKHTGTITVESKVGAGATFHIYLPAAKDM